MAPRIDIELDKSDWDDPRFERYYLAGSTVRGKVVVTASEPLDARAVRVAAGWHTEGRGDRDEGMVASATLHQGSIMGRQEFPFELKLPEDGPVTYEGHYIRIVWSVIAVIDLAWKKDPQAEQVFFVMPAPVL